MEFQMKKKTRLRTFSRLSFLNIVHCAGRQARRHSLSFGHTYQGRRNWGQGGGHHQSPPIHTLLADQLVLFQSGWGRLGIPTTRLLALLDFHTFLRPCIQAWCSCMSKHLARRFTSGDDFQPFFAWTDRQSERDRARDPYVFETEIDSHRDLLKSKEYMLIFS